MDNLLRLETADIEHRNVFTAHPFYSYFFERYNFFVAGSIEIAPGYHSTPKDIKQLMDLVKKQNVKAIFTHKQHNDKPAKVLAESTRIKEFELDPIGGVPGMMTYEEIILHNLDIIKKALK
jgi:zinc transport system substrate-binding protein